jgi:Skp family chaperone for outer membrane proteins
MRRLIAPVILVSLLAAVPAKAGKIGFVDAELAVSQVDEGKAKLAELQAWQAPYHTRLDRLREQVLALDDQLAEKQGKVTEEAYSEIQKRRIEAMRAFEDARREYERQLDAKKEEILSDIASKIGVIGAEYAKANGFDAVFLLKAQPMMYVDKSVNLTETVVEIYNQRYPVSGN